MPPRWLYPARRALRAFSSEPAAALPDRVQTVVVGGGIIGASTAYHIAKAGGDVLLLERDALTSGTTWHAAGLMVTFGSLSSTSTWMRQHSKELYSRVLEEETSMSTGFAPVGFIELAADRHRLEEYRRIAAYNRLCGVDVHEIGPSQVQKLFPLCRVDDIHAGFYVPDDGRVNPVDATMALARGARIYGATVVEGVEVTEVLKKPGAGRARAAGVKTACGQTVEAEAVVNCCGMWARQLGALHGVSVPNQAAEHYYLITDAMPEVDPSWPVIEDPSSHAYIRPEGGGLMVGLFEPEPAAWSLHEPIPRDASFLSLDPDMDRIAPFLEKAIARVPAAEGAGMKTLFCGPESFTPDGGPVLGEAPELPGYYVAAGMNSIGILTGGGVGALMAKWVLAGGERPADLDVTGVQIDRFQSYQTNTEYRGARCEETLSKVYACHYPTVQPKTGRGVKRSPLHAALHSAGAVWRDVSGWEGAEYYAGDAAAAEAAAAAKVDTFGRPACWAQWEAEHSAVRERAALIDMSFMAKFLVQGADAKRLLNWCATADVSEEGQIYYTQMLNAAGKIEADVTVSHWEGGRFLVVATDTMHRRTEHWLRRQIEATGSNAVVTDVTGGFAQLNLQGPLSRQILQSATRADLSDAAFPFRAAREIEIGCARAVCTRLTYVGELGYELFIPTEMAAHVHETLLAAGADVGLGHAGLRALGSLRMEKGCDGLGLWGSVQRSAHFLR